MKNLSTSTDHWYKTCCASPLHPVSVNKPDEERNVELCYDGAFKQQGIIIIVQFHLLCKMLVTNSCMKYYVYVGFSLT